MKSNLYNRKNNRGRGAGLTILTAALCVFSTLTALPATKTWNPLLRSSNWSTAGNWSPSGVPANGDDLVFNEGTSTNDLPNLRPKSLTFNGAYTLQGNPITLTGGITASHSTG